MTTETKEFNEKAEKFNDILQIRLWKEQGRQQALKEVEEMIDKCNKEQTDFTTDLIDTEKLKKRLQKLKEQKQ